MFTKTAFKKNKNKMIYLKNRYMVLKKKETYFKNKIK
jgi:hypothetical protein